MPGLVHTLSTSDASLDPLQFQIAQTSWYQVIFS